MINQALFTPLNLSRKLKKYEYSQNTVFYWYQRKASYYISTPSLEMFKEDVDKIKMICSAYTSEELGNLFPSSIWVSSDSTSTKKRECTFSFMRHKNSYVVSLLIVANNKDDEALEVKRIDNISEAISRAEMLVFIRKSQYN